MLSCNAVTLIEQQILDNLTALEAAAANMAANPKPDLMPLFRRLDELARQLPAGTEPDLLHYLHRKSYQKACALLRRRQRGTT
jgi:Tfp pilus assembly protein PilO